MKVTLVIQLNDRIQVADFAGMCAAYIKTGGKNAPLHEVMGDILNQIEKELPEGEYKGLAEALTKLLDEDFMELIEQHFEKKLT